MKYILAVLFLTLTLSGCVDSDPHCQEIGFPGTGASVHYAALFLDYEGRVRQEGVRDYQAMGPSWILGGDGITHQTMVIRREGGGALHHIDVETGDEFRYDRMAVPVSDLQMNGANALTGSWFFGRCLEQGDTWERPRGVPGFNLTMTVEEASTSQIVVGVDAPHVTPAVNGLKGKGSIDYRYTWTDSRLFPNQIEVFNDDRMDMPVARYVQESQEIVLSDTTASNSFPAQGSARPVDRWPVFDAALPMEVTFEEFVQDVEARPEVREYLEDHPEAYAAFVDYERIQETDSVATRWAALLRDDSDEAASVELVRRCFTDEKYVALWGSCRDATWYYGDDRDEQPAVYSINASGKIPELRAISASEALSLAGPFEPNRTPVRVQWRAYPHEERSNEFHFNEGRPGWMLYYGEITGQVDYAWPYGPRGTSMSHDTQAMPVDGVGWVLEHWYGSMFE